jgi:hypothetical protein
LPLEPHALEERSRAPRVGAASAWLPNRYDRFRWIGSLEHRKNALVKPVRCYVTVTEESIDRRRQESAFHRRSSGDTRVASDPKETNLMSQAIDSVETHF